MFVPPIWPPSIRWSTRLRRDTDNVMRITADMAAVVIQDLERGVAYNVDVVGRADINERVLPDVATALVGDLYIEVIGSGNIRGTNRNIGVAANVVPVRDSQTRKLQSPNYSCNRP